MLILIAIVVALDIMFNDAPFEHIMSAVFVIILLAGYWWKRKQGFQRCIGWYIFFAIGAVSWVGWHVIYTTLYEIVYPNNNPSAYTQPYSYFPTEIPKTATNVSYTYSYKLGQADGYRELSFNATPAEVQSYAEQGEKEATYTFLFSDGESPDNKSLSETAERVYDSLEKTYHQVLSASCNNMSPRWQRFFYGYVSHREVQRGFTKGSICYVWDTNGSWNHPVYHAIIVNPKTNFVVFYASGE